MSSPYRIGFGYDIHQLVIGRKLVLGGVNIPFHKGLKGHSDADCLTHALADAILGAAGLSDIGCYFPNTEEKYKGICSQVILKKAVEEAKAHGYNLVNADITVIAESPKIASFINEIKATLSITLGIGNSEIGIKATTNEKLGDIGCEEAIATHAVCLLTSEVDN